MKQLFIFFVTIALFLSCSENSTEPNATNDDAQTFISANVKTDGTQYFSFSENTGSMDVPAAWDIAFSTVPLVVETAPCEYFTMPNDPVILTGTNVTVATVNAANLDEVTEIPAAQEFFADVTESSPFLGQNWFNSQFECTEDVYVVKTCAGNYALMQIVEYQYNPANHTLHDIKWRFKYNPDGSTDFTTAEVDSFVSADANEEMKYFSFENGSVSSNETCEIKLDGSTFWLGENVSAKKLPTTDINSVTTVSDEDLQTDNMPSYVTLGWYDYGDGHLLTAKDYVYVVKANNGRHAAFEIVNYYNSEGESGTFTINWKFLD